MNLPALWKKHSTLPSFAHAFIAAYSSALKARVAFCMRVVVREPGLEVVVRAMLRYLVGGGGADDDRDRRDEGDKRIGVEFLLNQHGLPSE